VKLEIAACQLETVMWYSCITCMVTQQLRWNIDPAKTFSKFKFCELNYKYNIVYTALHCLCHFVLSKQWKSKFSDHSIEAITSPLSHYMDNVMVDVEDSKWL